LARADQLSLAVETSLTRRERSSAEGRRCRGFRKRSFPDIQGVSAMAGDAVDSTSADEGPLKRPWLFLSAGLGASALAAVLHGLPPSSSTADSVLLGVRLVLLGAGLLSAGWGVVLRPGEPAVLGAAAGATLLARLALNPEWDTV